MHEANSFLLMKTITDLILLSEKTTPPLNGFILSSSQHGDMLWSWDFCIHDQLLQTINIFYALAGTNLPVGNVDVVVIGHEYCDYLKLINHL